MLDIPFSYGKLNLNRNNTKFSSIEHGYKWEKIRSMIVIQYKLLYLWSSSKTWELSCNPRCTSHSSSQERDGCWCSHESSSGEVKSLKKVTYRLKQEQVILDEIENPWKILNQKRNRKATPMNKINTTQREAMRMITRWERAYCFLGSNHSGRLWMQVQCLWCGQRNPS